MAEALLRDGLKKRGSAIQVSSAGIGAMDGYSIDPIAVKLMQEQGIDASSHQSAKFSTATGLQNDLIFVMTKDMREAVLTGCPALFGRVYRLGHWGNFDIADPHMRGEEAFRKALKLIESGVAQWLERID